MALAKTVKRLFWIHTLIMQCIVSGAQYSKTGNVCLEHLNNGLTYCLSHEEDSHEISVKLMVKFDQRWTTEREKLLSSFLQMLVMESLEDNYSLQESKEKFYFSEIIMQEPQLYTVPNLILYRMDIAHPTQAVLDFSFAFLSQSLEAITVINLTQIQNKLETLFAHTQERGFLYNKNRIMSSYMEFDEEEKKLHELIEEMVALTPAITAQEVKQFCEYYYRPENMVLFVTGNLSHLVVDNSIKNYFSSLVAVKEEKSFKFGNYPLEQYSLRKIKYTSSGEQNRWLYSPFNVDEPEYKSFEELPLLEKEEKSIEKLMHTLANSNIPRLLWRQRELEKLGKSINHVHPLKFICHIVNQPILRSDLQEVHRNFFKWKGFLDGFRRRMTEEFYKGSLKEYVPGFCDALNIKPEVIEHFIDRRDWEGLVKAILY